MRPLAPASSEPPRPGRTARSGIVLLVGVLLLATGAAGCRWTLRVAEKVGVRGWFVAAVATPGLDYEARYAPLPLDQEAPCDRVAPGPASAPVWVLVHGVGGDGAEWVPVLDALGPTQTAGVYLYRWVPYDDLHAVGERFAAGVNRVLACRPDAEVRVIAHSAGGVVASWGAAGLVVPDGARVELLTVASPLAGTRPRERNGDGRPEARIMLDLGSAITAYPAAPPRVSVAHLRTSPPPPDAPELGDSVMVPSAGRLPNDPGVGVPGARQVDLPPELTHLGALAYVVERLVAGDPDGWLAGP